MAIRFNNHEKSFKLKEKRKIASWIRKIVASYGLTVGEISIIFTNDCYILEINNKFLKHNFYTDIITFDYSSENKIEGDIFISIDTVLFNSQEYKTTFNDEILRVIIHGVLHLIGFKDKTEREKKEMRSKEDLALNYFSGNE